MKDNRRLQEALSLRTFFDDQTHHLQELVGRLSGLIHDKEQQTEQDRQIVEGFVDATNNKMRAVSGYAHKLRGPVRALYNHVLQVAEEIPLPIALNPDAFRTDPLVNALFVSGTDIDQLLKTDPDVEAYLRAHNKYQIPVLYALLTVHKQEKRTLGVGMLGERVIRDVQQETINFSSQKIHTPCASRAELSTALKKYLFDRVVALVKQEMASRMTNQPFKPNDDSYALRVKSLANPDVYLKTLIEYLDIPANLLSINKTHLKLSKLGIKLDSDDRQCANEFDIHELTWIGNTRNMVLQIAHAR